MIYRILVDERRESRAFRDTYKLKTGASRALGKFLPRKCTAQVGALEGKSFDTLALLIEALQGRTGAKRYGLIAPFVPNQINISLAGDVKITTEWSNQEYRGHTGAGFGFLADVMVERGMDAPNIQNKRARFYFTKKGWQRVGRHVAAEAKRNGHHVQVLKRKNPEASQLVYADDLQVIILTKARFRIQR